MTPLIPVRPSPLPTAPSAAAPGTAKIRTARQAQEPPHPVVAFFAENRDWIEREIGFRNHQCPRRNLSLGDVMNEVFVKAAMRGLSLSEMTPDVLRRLVNNVFRRGNRKDEEWEKRTRTDTDMTSFLTGGGQRDDGPSSYFDVFHPEADGEIKTAGLEAPGAEALDAAKKDEPPAAWEQLTRLFAFLPPKERVAIEVERMHLRDDPFTPLSQYAIPPGQTDRKRYHQFDYRLRCAKQRLQDMAQAAAADPIWIQKQTPADPKVETLSPQQRDAWFLRQMGHKVRDIAQRIGTTPKTIKAALVLAYRKLDIIPLTTQRKAELAAQYTEPPAALTDKVKVWATLPGSMRGLMTLTLAGDSVAAAAATLQISRLSAGVAYRKARRLLGLGNPRTILKERLERAYEHPPVEHNIDVVKWQQLTPSERGAITESLAGCDREAIAARTGIALKSVDTVLSKGRRKLGLSATKGATQQYHDQPVAAPTNLPQVQAGWGKLRHSEQVIVSLLAQGLSRGEIAETLGITADTASQMLQDAGKRGGFRLAFRRPNQDKAVYLSRLASQPIAGTG